MCVKEKGRGGGGVARMRGREERMGGKKEAMRREEADR